MIVAMLGDLIILTLLVGLVVYWVYKLATEDRDPDI
jgi:hypothetical protein